MEITKASSPNRATKAHSAPRRIFIVDDHPAFLELLTDLFNSSADFEVVGTSDVAEGVVSGLAKTKAEILLLDLVLPDRGGIEIFPIFTRPANSDDCALVQGSNRRERQPKVQVRGRPQQANAR